MKRELRLFSVLMISVLISACGSSNQKSTEAAESTVAVETKSVDAPEASKSADKIKVTKKGVGVIAFGSDAAKLPDAVEGVYDRKESEYDDFVSATMHYLYLGDKLQYMIGYDNEIITMDVYDTNVDFGGFSVGDPVSKILKLNPKQEVANSGLLISINGCYLWLGGLNQSGEKKKQDAYGKLINVVLEESDFNESATLESVTVNASIVQ